MRYRDAHKAIAFLVAAFGFHCKAVYENPDGSVAHAELTFGNGMIMLGTAPASQHPNDELAQHLIHPDEINSRTTSTPYLIVQDPGATYDSAKAAGARILLELETKDYGGSGFTCTDPEGHLWSIGDYDPWTS